MALYAPSVKQRDGKALISSFSGQSNRSRQLQEPPKGKASNFCSCLLDIDLDILCGVFAEQWLHGDTIAPGEPVFHCCTCGTQAVQRQHGGDSALRAGKQSKEAGKKDKRNKKSGGPNKGSISDGTSSFLCTSKSSSDSAAGRCSNLSLSSFFSNWFSRKHKHKHTHELNSSSSVALTGPATALSASMKSATTTVSPAATVDELALPPTTPRTEQELFICVTCGACYCRSHAWDHNYSRGSATDVLSGPALHDSASSDESSAQTICAHYPNHSFFVAIPSYVSTHPCHIRSETDWGLLFPCVLIKEVEDGQIHCGSAPQRFDHDVARLVSEATQRHEEELQPHRRHNSAPMMFPPRRSGGGSAAAPAAATLGVLESDRVAVPSSPYHTHESVWPQECGPHSVSRIHHKDRTIMAAADDHPSNVCDARGRPRPSSSPRGVVVSFPTRIDNYMVRGGMCHSNHDHHSGHCRRPAALDSEPNRGAWVKAMPQVWSAPHLHDAYGVGCATSASAGAMHMSDTHEPSQPVDMNTTHGYATLSAPVYHGSQTLAGAPNWGYLVWCARCSVRPLCLNDRNYRAELAAHRHLRLLGHTLALLAYLRLRGVRLSAPTRYSEYMAYQLQLQLNRQIMMQHSHSHPHNQSHGKSHGAGAQMRGVMKTTEMVDWTGFGSSRPSLLGSHGGEVGGGDDPAALARRVPVTSRLFVDRTLAHFGICGFANPNYFCYINAVLQCVLRCMYFCRPLLRLGSSVCTHNSSSSNNNNNSSSNGNNNNVSSHNSTISMDYSVREGSLASGGGGGGGSFAPATTTTTAAAVVAVDAHKRYLSNDRMTQTILGNGLTMAMYRLLRHLRAQTYQDVLNRAANPFVFAVYKQVCRRGCGGTCDEECSSHANDNNSNNVSGGQSRSDEEINKSSGCLFEVNQQQDAHELLITLLNGVADEMDRGRSDEEKAAAKRISFEGTVRTEVLCCVCRNAVSRGEKFMSISVPVQPTLQESLDKVFNDSYLVDKNRYACENCFSKMSAQTQQMHNETVKVVSEAAAKQRRAAAAAAASAGEKGGGRGGAKSGGGFFGFRSAAKSSSKSSSTGARRAHGSECTSSHVSDGAGKAGGADADLILAPNCIYQDAVVHTEIERLGETLVIHLLRFQYNVEKQSFNKDTTPTHISFEIDLTPYASSTMLQEYNQVQDYHALQRRFRHTDEPTCRRYFREAGNSYRAAVAMMQRDGFAATPSQECSFDLSWRSHPRRLGERANGGGSGVALSELSQTQHSSSLGAPIEHNQRTPPEQAKEEETSTRTRNGTVTVSLDGSDRNGTGSEDGKHGTVYASGRRQPRNNKETAAAEHTAAVSSSPAPTANSVTAGIDGASSGCTAATRAGGAKSSSYGWMGDDFEPYRDTAGTSAPPTLVRHLVGIVTHRGSLHSGHYIAFVRYLERPDMWFCCDDEAVDLVDRKTVEEASVDTYLAFYE